MKASELIKQLKDLIDDHGDLDVLIPASMEAGLSQIGIVFIGTDEDESEYWITIE